MVLSVCCSVGWLVVSLTVWSVLSVYCSVGWLVVSLTVWSLLSVSQLAYLNDLPCRILHNNVAKLEKNRPLIRHILLCLVAFFRVGELFLPVGSFCGKGSGQI